MVAAGAAVDEETHLSPAAAVALSLGIVGAVSLLDEPLYNAVLGAATPAREAFFATVTHLGDGLTAVALTAALWPRDRDTAMLMGHAGLRAGLATVALEIRHLSALAPTRTPPNAPNTASGSAHASPCRRAIPPRRSAWPGCWHTGTPSKAGYGTVWPPWPAGPGWRPTITGLRTWRPGQS